MSHLNLIIDKFRQIFKFCFGENHTKVIAGDFDIFNLFIFCESSARTNKVLVINYIARQFLFTLTKFYRVAVSLKRNGFFIVAILTAV